MLKKITSIAFLALLLIPASNKETGGKSFNPKTKAEVSTSVKELAAAVRAQ